MPCFHPLKGYRSEAVNPSGKRSIVFDVRNSNEERVVLPCGQCIGCRLERSRQWAVRCMHEASLYKDNCFLTLTYAPEHLPKDGSLNVSDFQNFMKRTRKEFSPRKIRFFHCGEYGDTYGRPHFHACLFNLDFHDKYWWKKNATGEFDVFRSPTLEKLWPFGQSELGSVTFESAAYVARYITKKVTGRAAEDHYSYPDPVTGELVMRKPEYTTMSRRPGIGKPWLEKYARDVFPDDFIVVNRFNPDGTVKSSSQCKVPKFYMAELEKSNPAVFLEVKVNRESMAHTHAEDTTPDRLAVRERIQLARMKQLKRMFDHEV